jgi:hypothetical protein
LREYRAPRGIDVAFSALERSGSAARLPDPLKRIQFVVAAVRSSGFNKGVGGMSAVAPRTNGKCAVGFLT